VFQRQAVQKFHDDESFSVLIVDFVDGTDVGMIYEAGEPNARYSVAKNALRRASLAQGRLQAVRAAQILRCAKEACSG